MGEKPVQTSVQIPLSDIEDGQLRYPVDAAFILAKDITSPEKRLNSLIEAGKIYAKLNEVENALAVASYVKEDVTLGIGSKRILSDILVKLAENNWFDESIHVLESLPDNSEQNLVGEHLVFYLINIGQLDIAEEAIKAIRTPLKRNYLRGFLAKGYADKKQFEKAIKNVARVTVSYERDEVYLYIAHALAQAEYFDESQELLKKIDDLVLKNIGLKNLVIAAANLGNLNYALDRITLLEEPDFRDAGLSAIAIEGTKVGQPEKALQLLDAIQSMTYFDYTKAQISKVLAEFGQLDFALEIANTIQVPSNNAFAFFAIAKEHAIKENFDVAIETINRIKDPNQRAIYTPQLTTYFGKSTKYHYAQLMVRQISPNKVKDQSLSTYVIAFSIHGTTDRTIRFASEISDLTLRDSTLSTIAKEKTRAGQFNDAFEYIEAIQSAYLRASTTIYVAEGAFQLGNFDIAKSAVEKAIPFTSILKRNDEKADIYVSAANVYISLNVMNEAKKNLDSAELYINQTSDAKDRVKLFVRLGQGYSKTNDPNMALKFVKRLRTPAEQVQVLIQLPQLIYSNQRTEKEKINLLRDIISNRKNTSKN